MREQAPTIALARVGGYAAMRTTTPRASLMAEADDLAIDDLRKAVLNLADAVRVIAIGVDRLSLRLARSPIKEFDPSLWMEMNSIRTTIAPAIERLSAAVDLLVKDDDERST